MLNGLPDIPNWLLRQIVRPGGGRIAHKREKISPSILSPVKVPIIGRGPSIRTEAGNLTENEYRFWSGARVITSKLAICRYCSKYAIDYNERKQHQRATHCTTKLVAIFKLLLQAGKCVGCDKITTRAKWGVPICSAQCEDEWKFNSYNVAQTIKAANIAALKRGIIDEV